MRNFFVKFPALLAKASTIKLNTPENFEQGIDLSFRCVEFINNDDLFLLQDAEPRLEISLFITQRVIGLGYHVLKLT